MDARHSVMRLVWAIFVAWVVLFAGVAAVPAPCAAADASVAQVAAARVLMQHNFAQISHAMGASGAADLDDRLSNDQLLLASPDLRPSGYLASDWAERLHNVASLDTSIVRQVLAGKSDPLAGVHGLAERLIVSRTDGTLQPFAIYVPPNVSGNASLVVLLHGRPQTETDILSAPSFRRLADATGTIIVAPWGRGIYDFAQPAADEVYQILDAVTSAYPIGAHHVFLVGYSMGGFSVFSVGPLHGSRWAGIMCISGAILNSETRSVFMAFRDTPFYVVNGARDDSIPPQYGEMTAIWLAGAGIPTEFDQEPSGTHFVPTLMKSLTQAWGDMIAGVVKNPPSSRQVSLPNMAPPTMGLGAHP